MKKNNFINSLFAALLLASPLAIADQKYPAADFQPEVVYQDKEYIAKGTTAVESKATSKPAATTEADSKYPAADFQPQVVYIDTNYKKSDVAVSSSTVEKKSVSQETVQEAPSASDAVKEEPKQNYLVFIAIAAAAGFLLFRNKFVCPKKVVSTVSSAPAVTPGVTGVARYLNKKSGTGVSRYIDKQVKTAVAVTGVARYMAKQVATAKTNAATGVEKYMRNRG